MSLLDFLHWETNSKQYIASFVLLLVALGTRHLVVITVQKAPMAPEQRRRWMVLAQNIAVISVLLGLLIIWGDELRSFAISVVAVMAALVLATKELISCLTGAILKVGSNSFRIGDRIEVGGLRGEVIDHSLLTTTLLEIGPGQSFHQRTGRRLVFPNSLLLTNAVVNESFTDDYVLHVFSVVVDAAWDWREAESVLLEAATRASEEYIEDARLQMEALGKREGLDSSNAAPKVTLQVTEPGELKLLVRMAVPVTRRGIVEQQVVRAFADRQWRAAAGVDEAKGESPSR